MEKHMDIASRNQRLRETLESMGLFVLPIFCEVRPVEFDDMHVSVALPSFVEQGTQDATSRPVPAPMTRSEVAEDIKAADAGRSSVVNFPAKLR